MTGWQLFVSAWDWEPSVIVGCAALMLVYFLALRFKFPKVACCFVAGLIILLLALVSPLDTLGDTYLFSAHMLQHILLILVVPPLLLLGVPAGLANKLLHYPLVGTLERGLSKPILAWTIGVGTMWIWHWPPLYNAALANQPVHVVEHLMFLVSAVIFWWPVLDPVEEARLAPRSRGDLCFRRLYCPLGPRNSPDVCAPGTLSGLSASSGHARYPPAYSRSLGPYATRRSAVGRTPDVGSCLPCVSWFLACHARALVSNSGSCSALSPGQRCHFRRKTSEVPGEAHD